MTEILQLVEEVVLGGEVEGQGPGRHVEDGVPPLLQGVQQARHALLDKGWTRWSRPKALLTSLMRADEDNGLTW